MPYVSPRGTVKTTAPPRQQQPPPEEAVQGEEPSEHAPSAELGEVNSRDRDSSIVEELEHWKGWGVRHDVTDYEREDIDPLDPNGEVIVDEKMTDRGRKGKKPALRLVTEEKKNVVRVDEIDERFISEDLL
jgi:hypothetical protein